MNKPLILAVDDIPENLDVLVNLLSKDYRLKVATNGERALRLAVDREIPDLILLDIMMPEMDGYAVIEQLKKSPATAPIPVIFLTALSDSSCEEKGFNCGAVDYMTKPFNPPVVLARIRTHLALKQARDELMSQRDQLEESYNSLAALEAYRDDFVHMMVHDMSSPLTGICQNIEFAIAEIESRGGSSSLRDTLELCKESGENLGDIVRSMIDVSRLEKDQYPIHLAPCDLHELCKKVIRKRNRATGFDQARIESSKLPDNLVTDASVLDRVINNLLVNAIKFSPPGEEVILGLDQTENWIEVRIEDHGASIAEENQSRIFDKFEQVKTKHDGGRFDSGLGLAFCRLATDALGGSISVSSNPDSGTTFTLRLPVKSSHNEKVETQQEVDISEDRAVVRLLVVDDEWSVTKVIKRYMDKLNLNWQVETICNPSSVVNAVLRMKPDLLLLDINMDDKTGADIIRELKPHLDISLKTKIIYYTGLISAEETTMDYYVDGMQVPIISKTVPLDELAKIMMHCVNENRQ